MSQTQLRRFLIGALLGAAFFLIQAGVVEIVIGRDEACLAQASRMRLGPAPRLVCLPEFVLALLEAASKGFVGLVRPGASAGLSWFVMTLVYAGVGAALAQFPRRWAIGIFVGGHVLLTLVVGSIAYLSQYIV